MSADAEVLRLVRDVFARCAKPEHFTTYTHCAECLEHDTLLRSRCVDTLQLEDVGNPGWDPLCFCSAEGFAYYFPALARLALAGPTPTQDWYVPQLLFHLTYEGETNRHLLSFSPEQRRAVAGLLRHLAETRSQLADEWTCTDDLLRALELWSRSEVGA